MKNYLQRATRIQQRINELATFSDDLHSVNRLYGTKPFIDCGYKIASWMQDLSLETRIDNIGNIRGKLKSDNPHAKTLVIASHLDTTSHTGRYDGILGILMGLDIIENIQSKNVSLPFHIEVIAFIEEEGIRFHTAYLGSQVVSGVFEEKLLETKDGEGNTLAAVLQSLNYNSDEIKKDAIPPEEWMGYFEIHVEEGPILYEKNIPVGIVSAISGHKKIEIEFTGKTGHAGTVPMSMRRDALCAAAKFISGVEKFASKEKRNIVATIGKINIPDSASNVIPGKVNCTLDIRSDDKQLLSNAYEAINELCEKICDKRDIYFEWKLVQETEPVICSKKLRKLLSNSIAEKNIEIINLISGAGYDAVMISKVAPVVMLFIKCFKGASHHTLENVEDYDIAIALDISDHFMEQIISPSEKIIKKKSIV
ncbi:MAG: M20 family metallo-hydrolase [Ginsengibacter sp.]